MGGAGQQMEDPLMWNDTDVQLPPFGPNELGNHLKDQNGKDLPIDFLHGTTTLGFKYQGGVVLAVDSRATGGMYIGSGRVKKIIEINRFLLGTMAGGAADCMYWERVLSKQCGLYELRNKERISVAAASKLLSNICFNYKGMGLSMGTMIAGFDKRGPGLYYVDRRSIYHATHRDAASGGIVRVYHMKPTGFEVISEQDCKDLHYMYAEEKK